MPDDPDHVMYVWLDALTNYLSAVGYPDTQGDDYKTFWPGDHMVGKDILRFHAVYWPAFLMAAGIEPPNLVYAHGWWTNEGQKISKSLGNVIDPYEIVETYGLDQVRYFLLREVPFGNDGDFSQRAIVGRTNADLANDFGNLAKRVLSMIAKNCDGKLPEPGDFTEADERLLEACGTLLTHMRVDFHDHRFHVALTHHADLVTAANRYVDDQAPWAAAQDRSGAHGHGALRARRNHPHPRHARPSGHARRLRPHARNNWPWPRARGASPTWATRAA